MIDLRPRSPIIGGMEPGQRRRRTILDVARAAGVSTATVDRVLNGREGVRGATRARVLSAAGSLGYLDTPAALAAGTAAAPDRLPTFDFLVPEGTNTFMSLLARHLREMAGERQDRLSVRIHALEGFEPDRLVDRLEALRGRTDGVGLIALDHPLVREAVRRYAEDGVPVLTMVSDIANVPRIGYVGIDNRAGGRLAAYLMGRFMGRGPGKVALLAGSLAYRGHEEREMGFRRLLREEFPALDIVELRENRDDSERSYAETRTLLERHPDLGGIYNLGAGNRGVARALEEAGRAGRIVFVGHELTEHTRRFLIAGVMDAVIDQNPRVEAREAIDRLHAAHRQRSEPGLRLPLEVPVRVQAIFRENIPVV
jgi:LacI family transcriptional regulator